MSEGEKMRSSCHLLLLVMVMECGHATMISTKIGEASGVCDPPHIPHGMIVPMQRKYEAGFSVDILCLSGFVLRGDRRLYCNVDGTGKWVTASGYSFPECEALLCEPPPNVMHGKVHIARGNPLLGLEHEKYKDLEMYEEGSVAEYSCDAGYWLHPTSHARHTCHRGLWIGEPPQCVSQGCEEPSPVMNGYYIEIAGSSDQQYPPGARLQFVCHTGYILKGPDIFLCKEADGWIPRRKPKCEPSQQLLDSELCSVPPEVQYTVQKMVRGIVTSEGAFHGTTVEYRCRSGYRNTLAPCLAHSLTCHKGHWHGTSPECEEFNSCVAPPDIAHGYMYDGASPYSPQSQVYYACDPGYRLIGPTVLTCEDSGCWAPRMPPVCQLSHQFDDDIRNEKTILDMHTILVATTGSVIGILLIVLALILYQRAVGTKIVRLRNSGSGSNIPPPPPTCPTNPAQPQQENDPDRVALIAFPDEQGVPPSYEEAVRHRPAVMFDTHGGNSNGRYTPHAHRSRGHRVVVPSVSVRRSRHRDNPDNISYQSIGSARQSSSTSRSMSMRSWSACDSLGSTDTVAVSDSTNVTVDTQSGTSSNGSQAPSCRALAGSLASFDTSSLVNNEGAPLLEEAEGDDGCEHRTEDQFSLSTVSLQE
ncbi:uncharacterized protein [Macrobrachium rosenbergii]|uniref:uncharacterized protein isoform X1 n=1 Tax=Macrobrachium rosenbergii TaxID=79674 RepID=UPI0034D785BB